MWEKMRQEKELTAGPTIKEKGKGNSLWALRWFLLSLIFSIFSLQTKDGNVVKEKDEEIRERVWNFCISSFFLTTFLFLSFPSLLLLWRRKEEKKGKMEDRKARDCNQTMRHHSVEPKWGTIVHCVSLVWITLGFSLVLPLVLGLDAWVFSLHLQAYGWLMHQSSQHLSGKTSTNETWRGRYLRSYFRSSFSIGSQINAFAR